jgi:hypothetical protein
MRVRVGAAHHLAFVLENLHVADEIARGQVERLFGPQIDHRANVGGVHVGQCQVVARAETQHPADAALALDAEQRVIGWFIGGCTGQQGGKIVVKGERTGVLRILLATGATVAGAQVTGGIVGGARIRRRVGHLALPGPSGAVRRHQKPFVRQRVQSTMRMFTQIKHG